MNVNPELYPKFRTKRNKLTAYSFTCGYIETKKKNAIETTIWRDGGCNFYNIRRIDSIVKSQIWWKDAKTIKEARKIANSK